jgi:SAM-dependent methyltransferase
MVDVDLPYFDQIVGERRYGNSAAETFSRYVHWGVWPTLRSARTGEVGFAAAMERLDDTVTEGARLADGMSVLDVGCGLGGTLSRVSGQFPNARLLGVNIDHRQLVHAVKSTADFACADGCALPVRSGAVDAVLAVECIFHFPSRLAFLREAARVLKPGGRLSLSDFVPQTIESQASPVGQWCTRQISREYGYTAGWEDGDYATMAATSGLVVERDDDLTTRTLPTYLYLLREGVRNALARRDHFRVSSTALLGALSALGATRYRAVVFRKPETSRTSHEPATSR